MSGLEELALDQLIAHARGGLRQGLERSDPQPDPVDLLERMRSAGLMDAATFERLAEEFELPAQEEMSVPGLDAMVDSARAALDARVAASSLDPVPPMRVDTERKRGRAPYWAGVILAAAAAALAFVSFDFAGGEDEAQQAYEAPAVVRPDESSVAVSEGLRGSKPEAIPAVVIDEPEPEPEPELEPEPEPEPEPVERPETAKESKASKAERGPAKKTAKDWAKLGRQHWRDGELDEAERLLSRAAKQGSGRVAELAYGDLFSLTRQQGRMAARSRYWREYLQRYPAGRFAGDARAGLCRRASADRKVACWEDYLARHADGAYTSEAREAIEGDRQ